MRAASAASSASSSMRPARQPVAAGRGEGSKLSVVEVGLVVNAVEIAASSTSAPATRRRGGRRAEGGGARWATGGQRAAQGELTAMQTTPGSTRLPLATARRRCHDRARGVSYQLYWLSHEWKLYISGTNSLQKAFISVNISGTNSLQKTFISVKDIYYMAKIQGQKIAWLTPHALQQVLTDDDVYFNVMLTFLEFNEINYEDLMLQDILPSLRWMGRRWQRDVQRQPCTVRRWWGLVTCLQWQLPWQYRILGQRQGDLASKFVISNLSMDYLDRFLHFHVTR